MDKKVGKIVFIVGLIIAVLTGILGETIGLSGGRVIGILLVAGLIVGFLNVTEKETHQFLVAALTLVLIGATDVPSLMGVLPVIGSYLANILTNITLFVAPAALVVALKQAYALAAD